MLWPLNANISQANRLFDLLPTCSSEVFQIAGYPEYDVNPNRLEPEQKRTLSNLAQKIVDSHRTNAPYVAFLVVGHADTALRKPERERPAFEQQKSEERADAARNALLTQIMSLQGGEEVAKKTPI